MNSPKYAISKRTLFIILSIVAIITTTLPVITSVITDAIKVEAQSSGVDAASIYGTKSLDLGNNIKNLVILIPNEGHESQNIGDQSTDQRIVNQPYIPQHVTVPVGTAIIWFNGDVDHDHKITLGGQGSNFDSNVFAYNTASQPFVMNNTGSFDYYQADINNEDTNFVMNGTINVVDKSDNPNVTTGNTTGQPSANIDTIGTLMVPTEDLPTYTSDLENGGISILSTHNFNAIRNGDPQTLIIWATSSSGTDSLQNVVSQLEQITPTLPYS